MAINPGRLKDRINVVRLVDQRGDFGVTQSFPVSIEKRWGKVTPMREFERNQYKQDYGGVTDRLFFRGHIEQLIKSYADLLFQWTDRGTLKTFRPKSPIILVGGSAYNLCYILCEEITGIAEPEGS